MGSALSDLGMNSLSVLGLLSQINPETVSLQDLSAIISEADLPAFFDQITRTFVQAADETNIKERTATVSLIHEEDRWLVDGVNEQNDSGDSRK